MDRCPNCRARVEGADTCRRCGMDLAPLLAVERAAESRAAHAVRRLAQGDTAGALAGLEQARALKGSPQLDTLLGFARSLAGEGSITSPPRPDAEIAPGSPGPGSESPPLS